MKCIQILLKEVILTVDFCFEIDIFYSTLYSEF